MLQRLIRSLTLLAVMAVASVSLALVQEVSIQKPLNSPVLTVNYKDLNAAVVELRVNGRSLSTQRVDATAAKGNLQFTLATDALDDGDNKVEVLLYDANGKLLHTETSTLKAQLDTDSPVYIEGFKGGESVKGIVEIKLGLSENLGKNLYVSFFVNGSYKLLKNYEPYTFSWDTTGYPNGWHEVQAWVVDESNNTFKTRRVKLLVNNPGGRTNRVTPPATAPAQNSTAAAAQPARPPVVAPVVPAATTATTVIATVGKSQPVKRTAILPSVTTDQRLMTPTGRRIVGATASAPVAANVVQPKTPAPVTPARAPRTLPPVTPAKNAVDTSAPIRLGLGTRVPNIGSYTIVLNGSTVQFDVAPRVEEGIALTPFRHLFEHAGGEVKWDHDSKTVNAQGQGKEIVIQIGLTQAKVNSNWIRLERAAFIESSRTIVPLSFITEALDVKVDFDPKSKHVLITKSKK